MRVQATRFLYGCALCLAVCVLVAIGWGTGSVGIGQKLVLIVSFLSGPITGVTLALLAETPIGAIFWLFLALPAVFLLVFSFRRSSVLLLIIGLTAWIALGLTAVLSASI
jgi:hypothetical protein